MSRGLPLVIILGATGSGKTKLSLELAKKFKGEIISADSMQVYKGLDIITAKATKEEQAVAPHHMLDICEPNEIFTVLDYRNRALKIIDRLLGSNKLPIVVGGTNYYIESLLWKILVENEYKMEPFLSSNNDHELGSEELHQKLQILDPEMAKRLHPNNKRKILRSLEILAQKGKRHSEILQEQQSGVGGSPSGGPLRYSNAVIFHLECEKEVLDNRLNQRVDSMIEQGLIPELTAFHKAHNEHRMATDSDYSKGVFQSIGFKEFHPYLILPESERNTEKGQKLFELCVEELKMVTRRYARKQKKWTTNRFLGRKEREVPPMYGLDATDPTHWVAKVALPAFEITESCITGSACTHQRLPFCAGNSTANAHDETYVCDTCTRIFIGHYQWTLHMKSHRHKKVVERKKRMEQKETNKM